MVRPGARRAPLCTRLHIVKPVLLAENPRASTQPKPLSTFHDSLVTAGSLILGADPRLAQVVGLSLQVSGTACLLGAGFGLALGAWLAVARFPGHSLVVGVMNLSLIHI